MEEERLIFDVGVLDKNGNEIREIYIKAKNEVEMWKLFDRYHKPHYKHYDNAVIHDVNPE